MKYDEDEVITTKRNIFDLESAMSVPYDRTAVWTISKYMVRRIGANEIILLLELGELEGHNRNTISRMDLEKYTSFNQQTQEMAEYNLIGLGLITVEKTDDDMVNTYKLNHEIINAIIEGK